MEGEDKFDLPGRILQDSAGQSLQARASIPLLFLGV